jgi:hypothetical protein
MAKYQQFVAGVRPALESARSGWQSHLRRLYAGGPCDDVAAAKIGFRSEHAVSSSVGGYSLGDEKNFSDVSAVLSFGCGLPMNLKQRLEVEISVIQDDRI